MIYLIQCEEAVYTTEERHTIRKTLYNLFRMIFSDGDYGFRHDRLGRLCYGMALSSSEMGEKERSLEELDEMAGHFRQFYSCASLDLTSPLVRGMHYDSSQIGLSGEERLEESYLRMMSENPRFDAIRHEPKFAAIQKKLADSIDKSPK